MITGEQFDAALVVIEKHGASLMRRAEVLAHYAEFESQEFSSLWRKMAEQKAREADTLRAFVHHVRLHGATKD